MRKALEQRRRIRFDDQHFTLVGALTLVSGASAWNWLHNALFGLFGWGAIFVCVLLIYIAALLTMDKPVKGRAWMGGFLILFF